MRNKLSNKEIENAITVVKQITRAFASKHKQDPDELFSYALVKLADLIKSYDENKKAPFMAWLRICMRGHLLNYIRDNSRPIRLPRKELFHHMRMQAISRQTGIYNKKLLAKLANVSQTEVINSQTAYDTSFISDSYLTEVPSAESFEGIYSDAIAFLATLDDKQLSIATKFFNNEINLKQAAQKLGISQQDFGDWALNLKAKCNSLIEH